MAKPTSPALQSGNALATGLARCYTIHEGSGQTLHDFAAGNRDATTRTAGSAANATWGTDGTIGPFITLNGTSQDAAAPDLGLPTGAGERTVAILVRASQYSANYAGYVLGYGDTGNGLFAVGLAQPTSGTNTQPFRATTLSHGAGGVIDRVDNAWHLCVATIDSSTSLRIFVDGTQVQASVNGSNPSTDPLAFAPLATALAGTMYLGQAGGSPAQGLYFKGDLAGAWVWNRALSGSEITSFNTDPWQMVRNDSGGGGLTPPTGYTLAASPGSVATGSPATITATLTGGTYLASPLVITLAAAGGSGVTFPNGATITINDGSTAGSKVAQASTAGAKSITATHTGGGFTGGDGSTSFTATDAPDPSDGLPYGQVFDLLFPGRSTARVRATDVDGDPYPGLDWSTTPVRELGNGLYGVRLTLPAGVELWVQCDDGAGGPALFDYWSGAAGGSGGGGGGPSAQQIAAAVLALQFPGNAPANPIAGTLGNLPTEAEIGDLIEDKAGGISPELADKITATKAGVDSINAAAPVFVIQGSPAPTTTKVAGTAGALGNVRNWKNRVITIIDGPAINQQSVVQSYDPVTHVLTLDPPLEVAPQAMNLARLPGYVAGRR